MAFGAGHVDVLDCCLGKDVELRQIVGVLAKDAKQAGVDQQGGSLNAHERRVVHLPYERRVVYLALAEAPGVVTDGVGEAFSRTDNISLRK